MKKRLQRNNAMVEKSLKDGYAYGDYIGAPPTFARSGPEPNAPIVKVARGLPFVRRERKR
jgi:hypothetical protein